MKKMLMTVVLVIMVMLPIKVADSERVTRETNRIISEAIDIARNRDQYPAERVSELSCIVREITDDGRIIYEDGWKVITDDGYCIVVCESQVYGEV